ncbi:MAG: S41 family peptidase, partial [Bacteroidota bacterium]
MMQQLFTSILLFLGFFATAQNSTNIPVDKAIADLDFMVNTIEEVHYNPYFLISKDSFQRYKDAIYKGFEQDSISAKTFVVAGKKLTAALSGGHTSFDWESDVLIEEKKAFNYLPFTGRLNTEKQFVVTRSGVSDIKVGAIIERINGLSAAALFQEMMTYVGGIEDFKKAYIEADLPAFLFYHDDVKPPYTIQLAKSERPIELAGLEAKAASKFLYAEQATTNYTFEILEGNIGLIAYNSCQNAKAFERFLKKTFQTIASKNIDQLIVDIRQNGGGNSDLNDQLLAYLTPKAYQQMSGRYWKVSEQAKTSYRSNKVYGKMFGKAFMDEYAAAENGSVIKKLGDETYQNDSPKNVYQGAHCFLIGPRTFSSANMLADAIKTYELSTLIGEPTGELTNDFGEQVHLTLPYTKADLYVSSTYDIGANGNPDLFQAVMPDIAS